MKKKLSAVCMLIVMLINIFCSIQVSEAAVVSKKEKAYEIAVVFDNSGSMYENEAWCRAKYAMEIFASMLHYENGDVLKIFPMWEVTTDGSTPDSGGSYAGIEVRGSADIDKISNLYTTQAGNTPFAPILEAKQALEASSASEKWLIVLTDGEFNLVQRDDTYKDMDSGELLDRLKQAASGDIKVQYLGFGNASALKSDEDANFFAKKSSDTSLKDDLISICNNIFQRSVLPGKYIKGNKINLDMSMRSLIVFAQGEGAKIQGLKNDKGENIAVKLDSGQRKFSTIGAGGYDAPVDNSLAGQVVTFDACPKGKYELICSGADATEIFYEPDVDIKMTMTDEDGNEVDYSQGNISAGEYEINYSLVDAVTGEDVTKSPLMGKDVDLSAKVITADGTEKKVKNGKTITLMPDDATKIIVEGTYLKDYTISTEDDPNAFPILKVDLSKLKKFKIELKSKQASDWYQLGKESEWQPIIAEITTSGVPLTQEEFEKTKVDFKFSDHITYTVKPLPDASAYELMIAYDEQGNFKKPECGSYKVTATATHTDVMGKETTARDSLGFNVQTYSAMWRWLFWLLILLAILLLIIFILTRKAWPKEMYFNCARGAGKINIGKNMNLVSNIFPNVLACTAEKSSTLMKRFGKQASVKVIKVDPAFNVKSFKIGNTNVFTKDGGKYFDSNGKEFKEVTVRHNTKIEVEFTQKNKLPITGKICMNSKK